MSFKPNAFLEDVILDHIYTPYHCGRLENHSHTVTKQNSLCGDIVHLDLILNDQQITAAWQDGQGCALSQAAASILCEHIETQTLEELKTLTAADFLKLLGIPLTPTRQPCALLAFNGLQDILKQLESE